MAYMKNVGKRKTDKYKDFDTYADIIAYCCNPQKACAVGFANVSSVQNAAAEMDLAAMKGRKSVGKKICHIVITFSPEDLRCCSVNTVDYIAQRCMHYFSARYRVLYALHDYPRPHIHLVINRVSFVDGKRYLDRYEDRETFWAFLHGVLSNYGIRLWHD